MLVEVLSRDDSFVIDVPDDIANVLPFKSELIRWKEELYFRTPYEADLSSLKRYVRVEVGKAYYWPPGKAFCIFYGISEPYTEVYLIGNYLGTLSHLRRINEGEVDIRKHELYGELSPLTESLIKLGYAVSTPLSDGVRVIMASKYLGGARIALSVTKEDFGIYIESDSFFKYSEGPQDLRLAHRLKHKVNSLTNSVRLDLSEDGYVCLTATANDLTQLAAVVNELEYAYQYVLKELIAT